MLDIKVFKNLAIYFRNFIKYATLIITSVILAICAVAIFYKPTYEVLLKSEVIGYTVDKAGLQMRINKYMEGNMAEGVAFVQIDAIPDYKLCLLKKDVTLNDQEIYDKVTSGGTKYYKYYAVTDKGNEEAYVKEFSDAEKIIEELKNKNSTNKGTLGIVEKYETEQKEFNDVSTIVSKLYKKPVPKPVVRASASSGSVSGMNYNKVNLGIKLIRPVNGVITSRFGNRESIRSHPHRGLDIGAPKGTPIKAAASGTVVVTGWNGSYGNLIKISHGNGVETVYGHCSQILVSNGQQVSQGQVIGKVGSTGRSTGNHLHLEVRKNGVLYNPQHYVY